MASRLILGSLAMGYMMKSKRDSTINEMKDDQESGAPRRAICILHSQPGEVAKGVVQFSQQSFAQRVQITGEFDGLNPGKKHGFHIHQYGDLTKGCITAGPHFNPLNQLHGGPDSLMRHVGDLGNLQADSEGKAKIDMIDSQVTLYGPFSVVGRSCVLHKNEDDLGTADNEESKKTGNAGARIACGVIGLAQE